LLFKYSATDYDTQCQVTQNSNGRFTIAQIIYLSAPLPLSIEPSKL